MKTYTGNIIWPAAVAVLIIQGCSTAPVAQAPVPVEDQSVPAAGAAIRAEAPRQGSLSSTESPAVLALLDSAHLDMEAGKHESAALAMERALRLEPKNAVLWNRLALIRQLQGQWQQVLSLARKSNSLAAGDLRLQLQNWRLIAGACMKLNDIHGAEQAQKMVVKLSRSGGH